ncbi:armadillo repeat-containing protein 6 homolog [Zerene cesonia]|uniref:armadillo repeat-containing protein 6 homolog n=1 Tax=Zerene cesonia TaxID=33412 RepID=UPI0018E55578|nr:armadillo repeat-containing protein 6 homolog [Zerene cesonia]
MVRIISQETYDEVVRENIEEFDMAPEDAIKEAVAQFEAQGVDLSNIIRDLSLGAGDNHLVSVTVSKLKELPKNHNEAISKELDVLIAECNKDIAHRVRAGKEGAYNILLELLSASYNSYIQSPNEKEEIAFLKRVLASLIALMDSQPDLLESKGIDLIKSILDNVENQEILIATLKWISVCCLKHEINRQKIFAKDIIENLKTLLKIKGNIKLLSETLQVIRRLTLDDDIRLEFGKAHERARELGLHLLEPLTLLLKENTKPPLVSELMLTSASLLVRHELCAAVAERGGDVLFTVLADNFENAAVVQQAGKLITALAGNDDVKRQLVKSGIIPIIVSILARHSSNPTVAAITLKCIAALSLRESAHSRQFVDAGAAEHVAQCMLMHPADRSVQKNGCWAVRNIVARSRDLNVKFLELGIESILNKAYELFSKDFGYDIKSALRDLECDVKLDEQWTGKGVQLEQ